MILLINQTLDTTLIYPLSHRFTYVYFFHKRKKLVKKLLLGRLGNNKEYYERGVGWQTARHWCTHIAADAYAQRYRHRFNRLPAGCLC